ncbi:hypothetical protein BpHYR1_031022 [Brachionus plicatilis]|uniref:Uncharacterized protein n=1 Tax=Brachionus plicatilis TaxID=10195 RepID=A0A3M7PIQ5_BRAPC|nr:hypothetical protein BpHYR1_031022 [Brachionus plicatilis]
MFFQVIGVPQGEFFSLQFSSYEAVKLQSWSKSGALLVHELNFQDSFSAGVKFESVDGRLYQLAGRLSGHLDAFVFEPANSVLMVVADRSGSGTAQVGQHGVAVNLHQSGIDLEASTNGSCSCWTSLLLSFWLMNSLSSWLLAVENVVDVGPGLEAVVLGAVRIALGVELDEALDVLENGCVFVGQFYLVLDKVELFGARLYFEIEIDFGSAPGGFGRHVQAGCQLHIGWHAYVLNLVDVVFAGSWIKGRD